MISVNVDVFIKVICGIFGVMIGSFLNVLIYRLPRNINIAFPRSHCTNCNKLIYWYENIPIISYLYQKGRCSGCGSSIEVLYPSVELLTGCFALWLCPSSFEKYAILNFIFLFIVICIFMVHIIIDLKHQILPDSLNLILFVLFLGYGIQYKSWAFWLYGGLIGFFVPFIVTWLFYLLTKKVGMGGGDIKLYTCLGLILGPFGIIYNISLSCFVGAIVGGVWLLVANKSKNEPIPFGPFIIFVGFIQIFFPKVMIQILNFLPR